MMKMVEKFLWLSVVVAILLAVHLYSAVNTPVSASDDSSVVITVARGSSFRVVSNTLDEAGLIRSKSGLSFAAFLGGAHTKIKAGEYELSPSMTPLEILVSLVEGRTKVYTITFPEGYNINEMAAVVDAAGLADAADFIGGATAKESAASFGLDGKTLEGYLFPDTYRYTKDMASRDLMEVMVARFKEVYAGFGGSAVSLGMNMREVVTLASIIEKEAGNVEEMGLISAVFHNRLRKGYPLQSDPTVIYGIEDFDGDLTRKDLLTPSPYNTYRFYGLPPGPIANPGLSAIEAALNPADTSYLYFVSRNDGSHYFSDSLREHNRAVDYYQRGKLWRRPGA